MKLQTLEITPMLIHEASNMGITPMLMHEAANMGNNTCGASGSSLANLQQRVVIIGSPPLLDVIWRTQGTRKQ
jgi:hypothetical protein